MVNNNLTEKLKIYKKKVLMWQEKRRVKNHFHLYQDWFYNYKTGFEECHCKCGEIKMRRHFHKFTIWEFNPETGLDECICICGHVKQRLPLDETDDYVMIRKKF